MAIPFKIKKMHRKDFIKNACRICLLGASGATVINLASCSPSVGNALLKPTVINGQIEVPLTTFDTGKFQIISPAKYAYEISVEKKDNGTYKALLLSCTHYANQLMPSSNGFYCNAHGSKFNKEGEVVKGPAEHSLKELKTTVNDRSLVIYLV